jgi:hypothetical protein
VTWAVTLPAQRDVVRSGDRSVLADGALPPGVDRWTEGRFTVLAAPRDGRLAEAVLQLALANDTFPGLPRPRAAVVIAIAPDAAQFREWAGPAAPSWGAAVAFPTLQRIVMQGSRAGADAGAPAVTLRHELAHLALAEALGDLPPRWFDEGYASVSAGEWGREEALATSIGLAVRGVPTLEQLELLFYRGAGDAELAYALAHRAVADLMLLDPERGLRRFFEQWRATGSFEAALRQAYGVTSLDFERAWQRQTRRRYGALALLANLSLAFGVFAVIIGPFLWQRRRRDRERLEALRRADALQEEAAAASVLEAMLSVSGAVVSPDAVSPDAVSPDAVSPVVPSAPSAATSSAEAPSVDTSTGRP